MDSEAKTILAVGSEFSSYSDFKQALATYERKTLAKFSVSRSELSPTDDRLKYNYIKYGCKQFGEKRVNFNVTGKRPKQKTYKIGCQALLHVSRSWKNNTLVVRKLVEQHVHPCTETTFLGYPENRRLSSETVDEVKKLQRLKVKATHIKPILRVQEGSKLILGRDLSNIRSKSKREERAGRTDEEMLRDKLEELKVVDPNAFVYLEYDDDSKDVVFIFFQTSEMKESMAMFPEVLIMDITYKINRNKMPVCVIEVMNGEGMGEVVGYAFLANEQKETLTSVLQAFVTASGADILCNTKVVAVDKDFSEICAVRTCIPNAKVIICGVHVEKNFKKNVKNEPNKDLAFADLKGMLYSYSEETFSKCYESFKTHASETLLAYFHDNWYQKKELWSLKDKALVMSLRNYTTNRVERHNSILKMVLDLDTPLYDAVSGIINIVLANKKADLKYSDHEALTKKVYINKGSDPLMNVICNELTDFAARIVCEQLQLSKKTSPFPNLYENTVDSCSCELFMSMRLTCRHIMRLRRNVEAPLYTKESIPERWWRDYNIRSARDGTNVNPASDTVIFHPRMPGEAVRILSNRQKFNKAKPILSKSEDLVVGSKPKTFYKRFQLLNDIFTAWDNEKEISLLHLNGHQELSEGVANTGNIPEIIIDGDGEENYEISQTQDPPCNTEVSQEIEHGDLSSATGESSKETHSSVNKETLPQSAPFKLSEVKTKGRTRGRGETVHDGSKHAKAKKKWSFRDSVVSANECCVCGDAAGAHKCNLCKNTVHAIPPCSLPAPGAKEGYGQSRICNYCDAGSNDSSNPPSNNINPISSHCASVQDRPCFGCKAQVIRRITKGGLNKGCAYYGCPQPVQGHKYCKNFLFWEPGTKLPPRHKSNAVPASPNLEVNSCASELVEDHESEILLSNALDTFEESFHGSCSDNEKANATRSSHQSSKAIEVICIEDDDDDELIMEDHVKRENRSEKSQDLRKVEKKWRCFYFFQQEACITSVNWCGIGNICCICAKTIENEERCECTVCGKAAHVDSNCSLPDYITGERGAASEFVRSCRHCICQTCKQPAFKPHICLCVSCKEPTRDNSICVNCVQPVHHCCSSPVGDDVVCNNCTFRQDVGMSPSDVDMLLSDDMLSDTVISKCLVVLKEQFPNIMGFNPPISKESDLLPFPPLGEEHRTYPSSKNGTPYIQILYTGYHHWIACYKSKNFKNEIAVLNSSGSLDIGSFVEQQLALIVNCQSSPFIASYFKVKDQQDSVNECGSIAVAICTELAFTNKISYVDFDLGKIRSHILKCLTKKKFEPFPRNGLSQPANRVKFEDVVVVCNCRLPYHYDSQTVMCSNYKRNPRCRKWYHYKCVGLTEKPKERCWDCNICKRK